MSQKQQTLAATLWLASCGLWAYVTCGELVVAADFPEILAALGLVLTMVGAGRRVAPLFSSTQSLLRAAVIATLGSVAAVFVVAFALLSFGASKHGVTGLLLVSTALTGLITYRRTRTPMPLDTLPQTGARVVTAVGWLTATCLTIAVAFLIGNEA